jgi:ribitol-5-phosphate 2-dehydrogenase (NADP+) / D-ribitol-5-phosphate cytidylyltransferase
MNKNYQMPNSKCSIVILAAGSGTRMGTNKPKQFLEIRGRTVLDYTISNCAKVTEDIIVVTREDFLDELSSEYPKFKVVLGGETRFDSVLNGLNASSNDIVIVHDAVRPFVDERILIELTKNAEMYPGVGTVVPLVDTILKVDEENFLKETPDRYNFVDSQTPQAFQKEFLMKALQRKDLHNTELLELVRLAGGKVKLVDGSPWYFKITHKPDIYAAEGFLDELEGKVAIVTGGTSGIGEKVVRRLRDAGQKVYALGLESDKADIKLDVRNSDVVAKVFKDIFEKEGRIDVLVNNAGIAENAPLEKTTDKMWTEIMETNLFGAFYCLREALKYMQRGSVIVNVASSGINGGREGEGAYGSSKISLEHLSKVAALENKQSGISVFTVCPTRTNTPLRAKLHPGEEVFDLAQPDEPAKVIAFCCTNDLSLLTGQTFWLRRK